MTTSSPRPAGTSTPTTPTTSSPSGTSPAKHEDPATPSNHHHGTLYARTLGQGPPVVLLHGLVGSSRYWDATYDDLARDHQLVVPDLLGFGQSPKPPAGYTPDDHVDALVAVLDELGATGPAAVAAHSAGSIVALRLALRHPERVRAIVAFGPPLYPDAPAARAHLAAMGPMARLFALPGPIAAAVCGWVCAHRPLAARLAVLTHPHLPAAVAADSVAHTWASYTGTLTNVVLAGEASSWLPDIAAPVTFVAGDRDRVVDRRHLAVLASNTQVRSVNVAGDHHLPLRQQQQCLALLTQAANPS